MKRILFFTALFMAASMVHAQTASLTADTSAIGFLDKDKSAGTKITETYPVHFFNTDGTSYIAMQGTEVINSGLSTTTYLGGVDYRPNTGAWLKKNTTFSSDAITIDVMGGLGNTLYSTATGDHFSWLGGAKVNVKLSSSVSAKAFEAGYMSIGTTRAPYVSAGFLFKVFGGSN